MKEISWNDFEQVELRVGTVLRAEPYPEARKPALKLWVDFGPEIGTLKSSAQISVHYSPESLVGTQIVGVVNFPDKQIGAFMSQFLATGFADENGAIVLARPDHYVPDGSKLC